MAWRSVGRLRRARSGASNWLLVVLFAHTLRAFGPPLATGRARPAPELRSMRTTAATAKPSGEQRRSRRLRNPAGAQAVTHWRDPQTFTPWTLIGQVRGYSRFP